MLPYKESQPKLKQASDVTLEVNADGSQFLHLILPADRINFLNGINLSNNLFNESTEDNNDHSLDSMMIEVGCKIFEVNRIAYRSKPKIDV